MTGQSQPGGGRNRHSPQSLSGLSGGQISISTHLRKGSIVIEISDTGPGIPEEDLQRIFDPFYTQKKTMVIGVGLPICNGIIEDHKGTITAKNLEDRGGACFVITLPGEQI
ncbi:Adaptive-response sensory-kinase SasA [subsurface metagenome]